tara:strand:- start:179 stop:754 length:576 start_codon:yes stop_codon:yes gene_type:complete
MADPAYIVDGVLTDGEAWVGIATASPSAANVQFVSTDDGQVGDWSQYMDLVVVMYARSSYAATSDDMYFRYNNDTGSNYMYQRLRGDGSAATAYSGEYSFAYTGKCPAATATANIFGAAVATLFDINSGKYKSAISNAASDLDGSGYADMRATTWKSQAPIIEIDIGPASGAFAAGSMFSLFGILPRMVTA